MTRQILPHTRHRAQMRLSAVRKLVDTHDPRSLFVAGASGLLGVTLIIDLLLHADDFHFGLLIALILVAFSTSATVFWLGARFPPWASHSILGVFILVSVLFVSPLSSEQPAVSTMQEFPLIAFYLSWFVRLRTGRILIWVITASFATMMAINPIFGYDGSLGSVSGVQSLIVMLVCFEFGAALRVRTERRVVTDQLTGVLNRGGFVSRLERELARSQRNGVPLSLVVIDFDDFKHINDSQGHAAGDAVLRRAVSQWKIQLRRGDVIGRTGGDEFAILLNRSTAHTAQYIIARLRDHSDSSWSWGISQARPGDTVDSFVARADVVLYNFKRRRRAPAI